jgi:hypothetical protein
MAEAERVPDFVRKSLQTLTALVELEVAGLALGNPDVAAEFARLAAVQAVE